MQEWASKRERRAIMSNNVTKQKKKTKIKPVNMCVSVMKKMSEEEENEVKRKK
jgi:hypothetical protein